LDRLKKLLLNYARPLDVFTVNYDTSIEVFCLTRGIPFNNGFERTWRPEVLEKAEETALRLYKVHGSVTWWATDEGTIVEIPVRIDEPQTRLYYGTKAQTLVIYPGTPSKVAAPSLELLPLLRKRLLDADLCVIAGYSLRDEEIRRILLNAVRDNPSIAIIVLGPSAFGIYEERLKWVAAGVPSAVQGSVSILPFRFEGALYNLHDTILRYAVDGWRRYRLLSATTERYGNAGHPDEWSYAGQSLARGGFLELGLDVMRRSNPGSWGFEHHLGTVINLFWIAAWARAEEVVKALQQDLGQLITRIETSAVIAASGDGVSLTFKSRPGEGNLDVSRFRIMIEEALNEADNHSGHARVPKGGTAPPSIVHFRQGLASIVDQLKGRWKDSSAVGSIEPHWTSWRDFFRREVNSDLEAHDAVALLTRNPDLLSRLSIFEGKSIASALK